MTAKSVINKFESILSHSLTDRTQKEKKHILCMIPFELMKNNKLIFRVCKDGL